MLKVLLLNASKRLTVIEHWKKTKRIRSIIKLIKCYRIAREKGYSIYTDANRGKKELELKHACVGPVKIPE